MTLLLAALMVSITSSVTLANGSLPMPTESDSLRFRFELDNDYSTSAGVFDTDGTLIRTLWSNRRYEAGAHESAWDGHDDDGRPVNTASDYEIRVLTHNVTYVWDGVIGNTSPDATSPFHHDGPYFFADLVVSGDRAFFTTPSEGAVPTMRYFRLDAPQSWRARPAIAMSHGATMGLIAADRERVYWAHDSSPWPHAWGKGGDQAFVIATDRDLSHEIEFEAGAATCVQRTEQGCYRDAEMDARIRSAIDVVTEFRENPATPALEGSRNNVTGIAVQADGPLLFVAHGRLEPARIHVLDKRSGRPLGHVPLAGVGRLVAVPGNEDLPADLWAIHDGAHGRVVSRLRIGSAPAFPLQIVRTLAGLESPIALALTPDGKRIVVADGGGSQQLKAFDAATGDPLWQMGAKGGYRANGPQVDTGKLSFYRYDVNSQTGARSEQTVLGFAPDGSFWIGDTGLSRLLKFDSGRRYLDRIAFTPINYNVAVDRNDPTRVFAGYQEYAVDYTRPIEHGWRLVRYFGDGAQAVGGYHAFDKGFVDVATLRNGRTYGLLRARDGIELVEIPASGDLKRLPVRLQRPVFLSRKGDLYSVRSGASGRAEFWRRPLQGFDDDSGTPRWGREESAARVGRGARDPRVNPYRSSLERSVAELEPDGYVLFDGANSDAANSDAANSDAANARNERAQLDGDGSPQRVSRVNPFHLAAVQSGASRWRWRASPAAAPFDFAQPDGVFDTSRPWYAGMAVSALDDQIVYNFHGEGWQNAGQANQFLHWYRNGLFVGQFGVPNERGIPPAAAGLAGNSLSTQLVEAGGKLYLWHNDENAHAGVHRWRLDGVEWMRELAGRGRPGENIALARVPARDGGDARDGGAPSSLAAKAAGSEIRLTWENSAADARGIEVQRLQPTYVGPRFERIALLPAGAKSFVDANPLPGEPTVYRVRARLAAGNTDYSNHVHLTAKSKPVVLESQSFETPPPGLRDDFHLRATPEVQAGVIADPANPRNRVLRVLARKPAASKELRARVRWKASAELFRALNTSVGRARGSRPDIYRVEMRVRLLQARLARDSEVSVQVDPGYNLFSTSGRRQSLPRLFAAHEERAQARRAQHAQAGRPQPEQAQADRAQTQLVSVSFNFAALPNGAGAEGLRQYRSTAPSELSIVFPISLRGDGDIVEFLVDDLTVARLDPDTGGPE